MKNVDYLQYFTDSPTAYAKIVARTSWIQLPEHVQLESLNAFADARNGEIIDFAAGCLIF